MLYRCFHVVLPVFLLATFLLASGCGSKNPEGAAELPANASWEQMEEAARDQTVTMMMWQGDPLINRYMQEWVRPRVKERFGIDLELVSGQGSQVVSTLMAEQDAGRKTSALDLVWINGETFYQLRQIDGLYGPFTERLPNSRYVNWGSPFIAYDFQQPVNGWECPWGNVQMALIYDTAQVPQPPQTLADWERWWAANPGKFTFGHDFTGMTLLKSWLIAFAGGDTALNGAFDEALYAQHSAELWAFINRNKKHFWNKGQSFPASLAQMHQLFANGELWFTMSNNDAEVDNKIAEGFFPGNSRAYVPLTGTIQNSHYLGIPAGAAEREAAMLVINFLISPEAQWEKMKPSVWGDGTILALDKLEPEWAQRFDALHGRKYAPDRAIIQDRALMEPAPEYMIRLFADFRTHVINQ
ncbi:MAG: ABC transporter substrate-binding protein [Bacteroidetes bacterium]|nr:ABC transporter substrate-binding protein [Bacteroidota bacterium]